MNDYEQYIKNIMWYVFFEFASIYHLCLTFLHSAYTYRLLNITTVKHLEQTPNYCSDDKFLQALSLDHYR